MGRPQLRLVLAGVMALAALPAPAKGAVTIGSSLSAAPFGGLACGSATCTYANTTLPAAQVTSPINGVVVRWRARIGGTPGASIRLEVIRGGAGAHTGVNLSATQVLPGGGAATHTFATRQPIMAGDQVALDADAGGLGSTTIEAAGPTAGVTKVTWSPSLLVGETRAGSVLSPGNELLINADVEPDADCDGFGDETQDPVVSGGCAPKKGAGLLGGAVKTNGKNVPLQLSCALTGGNCDGNDVMLQTAGKVGLGAAAAKRKKGKRKKGKRKKLTLGGTSFSIPAGQTQTVVVPLTKRGRKLFKSRKKVGANVTITGGGASSTATLQIKRKGKKKRRK